MTPLARRLSLLAVAGGAAAVNVGVAAFLMRAEDALQLPFVDLLHGDLSPPRRRPASASPSSR